ncbi:PT domain-containing protein [Asanoa sp. NPDC049573]|uniref:PT domain-containing protein n=1 Tax=Asanoa sp. NPDC049573 TaxID=3155396 RepID=UPI00342A8EC2
MTRLLRPGFVLAAAAVTLFAVAGCGSGDASGATPASGTGGAGFTAYRDCLGKQGITLPSAPAGFAVRPSDRPSGRPSGRPTAFPSGRPTAFPSGRPTAFPWGRPTAFPSGRPTAFPSGRPTAFPSGRPTTFPSGRPGGRGFPGGGFGGMRPQGVDEQTWQKAQEACASLLPTGRPAGEPGRRGGGNRGADTAYRNCLSDHGAEGGATPDAAALEACAVLRPTGAPQPTPTS